MLTQLKEYLLERTRHTVRPASSRTVRITTTAIMKGGTSVKQESPSTKSQKQFPQNLFQFFDARFLLCCKNESERQLSVILQLQQFYSK